MDYMGMYKSRVLKGATNSKERLVGELERSFEKYLRESPTCKELPITKVGEFPDLNTMSKELVSVNDVSNNDKKALDEKNLRVRKDCNIDVGCYVFFDNTWFLIVFKEHKIMDTYKKFIMRRCNQIMKYKYKGIIYDIPLSVDNLTLYSDGLSDIRYTSAGDAKRMMSYGSNEITKSIDVGTRIMFTNKVTFRATNINDFEFNGAYTGADGLIKTLLLQTALVDNDDLENNVAWNPISTNVEIPVTHKIQGDKFIYLGAKNNYSITYSEDVEWLLDNDYLAIGINYQDVKSCVLESKSLAKYVGVNGLLIARNKGTKEVIDMKTIVVRG